MKHEIYLFNPDNDLALAHGGGHYIAPPFAQQLAHDLAALPMWIAPEGACVLVPEEISEWVKKKCAFEKLDVSPITRRELNDLDDASFHPWGWSGTIKQRLSRMGVKDAFLPSDMLMTAVRDLSHRRMSIKVHEGITRLMDHQFSPIPVELTDYNAVKTFAEAHSGCYLKMPWSGSGQGVYHVTDINNADFENRVRGALKRQGSLLCEIGLNSILDFALEFKCENSKARFAGYSVFKSDEHSQYQAGLVAPQEILHDKIASQYSGIDAIKECMEKVISELYAPHYNGYLGVDMMLYRDGNDININPCIEVNVRTTMGVVTAALGDKGYKGIFRIAFNKNGLRKEDFEGKLMLTPIIEGTQYCAYIDEL